MKENKSHAQKGHANERQHIKRRENCLFITKARYKYKDMLKSTKLLQVQNAIILELPNLQELSTSNEFKNR